MSQQDAEVSGTCKSPFLGEAKLTGVLAGNTVELKLAADFNGNALELTYTGAVVADGSQMQGNVVVAGFGAEAPFTGTKQD